MLFKRGHWLFKLSIILRRTCRCNLNSGFQSLAGFRIPNAEFRIHRAGKTCDLFCCKTSWMERFHSPGQHLCKLIGTKEIVCISKEFNVHRIGLEHQYGRRDVNTLYSDVARFTTHESNLSCNKSVCCRLRKVVAESRELFYFLQENLYNLRSFYRPKANLFCSKWRNFHV